MPDEEKYDWESCEYSRRSTHERTQEKRVFHPCDLEPVEYVTWDDRFGGPSVKLPIDSHVFRKHGMEPHVEARLTITGSIDFICGVGELDLTIDIDEAAFEKQYLKELLQMLKLARHVIKDRQAYLKQQKTKEKPDA